MTASDDDDPERHNCGSPGTTDASKRKQAEALASIVRNEGGWIDKERLVHKLGITEGRCDELLGVLVGEGTVELVDLGRVTVVKHPLVDVEDAIAGVFDRHERIERGGDALAWRRRG